MRKIILFIIMALSVQTAFSQMSERTFIRDGNRKFNDSLFIKAEENYLRAIDRNPGMVEGYYDLANSYLAQQKPNEAIEQYSKAVSLLESEKKTLEEAGQYDSREMARCKENLSHAYHNAGVVFHQCNQYDKAVGAYRNALRNNPNDEETRFNLIQAMKQLQEQQQNQDQQDQQDQQNQDQQQDQEQQQQDQQQQDQEQQQQDQQEMSQENAEQLLEAAMQDEKDVQERVQQMIKVQPKKPLEKDW